MGSSNSIRERDDLALAIHARRIVAEGQLRSIRLASLATQLDMAEAVGCSQSTYAGWELRRSMPSGRRARRLGRVLEQLQAGQAGDPDS